MINNNIEVINKVNQYIEHHAKFTDIIKFAQSLENHNLNSILSDKNVQNINIEK